MENTILEAIKLFMAIASGLFIVYLLLINMRRNAEILSLQHEIEEAQKEYQELYDKMVFDISKLEQKNRNQKISYENKMDKLQEVIHNLEKNKC